MALPDTRRLEDLAIEPLSELCKEAYEETAWALENTLKKAVHFGRLLCIAKTKVPHGQWIPWVTETFEDQVSLRNIQRFMQVAESNTTDPSLLEGAKNLDEAMALIQVKKTSVEVIEVEATVPEVAVELPPQQSFPMTPEPAVATVKPVAKSPKEKPTETKPAKPDKAAAVAVSAAEDDDGYDALFEHAKDLTDKLVEMKRQLIHRFRLDERQFIWQQVVVEQLEDHQWDPDAKVELVNVLLNQLSQVELKAVKKSVVARLKAF